MIYPISDGFHVVEVFCGGYVSQEKSCSRAVLRHSIPDTMCEALSIQMKLSLFKLWGPRSSSVAEPSYDDNVPQESNKTADLPISSQLRRNVINGLTGLCREPNIQLECLIK
jgi:hypothetical protein